MFIRLGLRECGNIALLLITLLVIVALATRGILKYMDFADKIFLKNLEIS